MMLFKSGDLYESPLGARAGQAARTERPADIRIAREGRVRTGPLTRRLQLLLRGGFSESFRRFRPRDDFSSPHNLIRTVRRRQDSPTGRARGGRAAVARGGGRAGPESSIGNSLTLQNKPRRLFLFFKKKD
jgi:hypothetical protein